MSKILAALAGLSLATAYLVDPPTTAAPDTIQDCSNWVVAASGKTCTSIARDFAISVSDFQLVYNPSVGTACKLTLGNSYCVERNWGVPVDPPTSSTSSAAPTTTSGNGIATPTPIQDGMTKDCNKFYFVKSGDSCQGICTTNGVALPDFYKWNPAVGSNCETLWGSTYVCIGVIGGPTTTTKPATSSTTTPGNGVSTPTPTQPGIVSNCARFYFVKSGDTCAAIASAHSISVADFQKWNTLDAGCTNIWANTYACVGLIGTTPNPTSTTKPATSTTSSGNGISTPTPTQPGMVGNCNKFYLVKSGDTCSSISTSQGVSVANIIKWNTLNSGCTDMWAAAYLCIGVKA